MPNVQEAHCQRSILRHGFSPLASVRGGFPETDYPFAHQFIQLAHDSISRNVKHDFCFIDSVLVILYPRKGWVPYTRL